MTLGSRIGSRPAKRAGFLVLAAAVGVVAAFGTTAVTTSRTVTVVKSVASAQGVSSSSTTALTPSQIYAQDAAGVVDVVATTTETDPFGYTHTAKSEGSGFVIDTNGDIVTNAHVVEGTSSITVTFEDHSKARARLVGSATSSDIALIRVSVPAAKLHPLAFGDSKTVEVGDQVVAIGSPFGFPQSMTSGIVSAVARKIEAPNGAVIRSAIQTDAAINPGNSGGPLIDTSGQVIGVTAQISSSSSGNEGVGFAIPSATVKTATLGILGKTGV